MDRIILHSDLNSFYASVACVQDPSIRDLPVAVCGSEELRHGIVLARNQIAKDFGVKTAEAIWQAKRKCPDLVMVPPNHTLYQEYSHRARQIYADYTDQVEPYGIDECWLDVTGSTGLFGDGVQIAQTIRMRMKQELGITVSIGVSFDKIFAKLGSDYKKPDAITVFSRENFREKTWGLPIENLLYVGSATQKKLNGRGIYTIGELAQTDSAYLKSLCGKAGQMLHTFANGQDSTPVARIEDIAPPKSIGNSSTAAHDLTCEEDVKILLLELVESVSTRLRKHGFQAQTVAISIRANDFSSFERQVKLTYPTDITTEIMSAALQLFRENWKWQRPIRMIGVRVTDFLCDTHCLQLDLYGDARKREKQESLDKTVDELRERFGSSCVQRAVIMKDKVSTSNDTV